VEASDQRRHLNLLIIITLIATPLQWVLNLILQGDTPWNSN
jgi:hypothetical protein